MTISTSKTVFLVLFIAFYVVPPSNSYRQRHDIDHLRDTNEAIILHRLASVKLLDRLVKIGYNASTKQGNPGHEVPGCPPHRITTRNRRIRRTGPGEWTGTDCPVERGVTGCKPPSEAIRRRSPGSRLADGKAVGQLGYARYSSRVGGCLIGYQLSVKQGGTAEGDPFRPCG
jgi:hypothetical protein